MNWDQISAIAAVVGAFFTVAGVIYVSGKLSQRVSDHGLKLNDHEIRLDTHDRRLGGHDISLARLEGFRDGVASTRSEQSEAR